MAHRQIKFWLVVACASAQIAWAYERKESADFARRDLACEQIARAQHFAEAGNCLAPLVASAKYDTTKSELAYRQAEWSERAEDFAGARTAFLAVAHTYPRETMAARARFRAARILEDDLGDVPAALGEYKTLVREAPDSVAAVNALSHAERLLPAAEVTPFLSAELQARPHRGLAVTLMRHLAERLEKDPAAAELFDRVAATEPAGPARITATYLAARAWLAAGNVGSALARLQTVVDSHEGSILPGDTNSAEIDDAALLIGQIYRDQLHDAKRAREAFERVVHDYPESRLVDDALYALEQLALAQGDRGAARLYYARLVRVRPGSRFARAELAPQ
jgi:TolA-binding protein